MSDRRLSVRTNRDGTYTLTGVAYEADRPDINRVVYPKAVLEKALAEYLEKPEAARLLTVGCAPRPKLADVIGIVTGGEIVGSEVRIEAKTLKVRAADVAIEAGRVGGLAFAGAGFSPETIEPDENSVLTLNEFTITSMGVVPIGEVDPGESSGG